MPMPRSVAGAVCAVLLLALFAGLSIWEMSGDSLTPDERAHLPAGYAYWVEGEFRLNPEHPPFVKLLCAAPLLFMDLKVPPTEPPAGATFHNYIAKFGTAFLSQGLDRILFWGRLPVVGLGLLLGSLVFSWSRRIHGQAGAGLVSIFLLALEPTLLAHSHFITTDVALACFTIMAFSFLWRFCEAGGDGRHLILAVAGMGLALASKFSAVVLLPLFFLLWFLRWPVRAPATGGQAPREPVAGRGRSLPGHRLHHPGLLLLFSGPVSVLQGSRDGAGQQAGELPRLRGRQVLRRRPVVVRAVRLLPEDTAGDPVRHRGGRCLVPARSGARRGGAALRPAALGLLRGRRLSVRRQLRRALHDPGDGVPARHRRAGVEPAGGGPRPPAGRGGAGAVACGVGRPRLSPLHRLLQRDHRRPRERGPLHARLEPGLGAGPEAAGALPGGSEAAAAAPRLLGGEPPRGVRDPVQTLGGRHAGRGRTAGRGRSAPGSLRHQRQQAHRSEEAR